MAADKPPQLGPRGERRKDCVALTLIVAFAIVFVAAVIIGSMSLSFYLDRKYPSTVFTVAITGVAGLDDPVLQDVVVDTPTDLLAAGRRRRRLQQRQQPFPVRPAPAPTTTALISPVFNLAFQVDNRGNEDHDACVPGFSRADVSYYGPDAAFFLLAGGSVPPLCAGEQRRSGRVTATARGENVAVPLSVRDRLAAGDASVDVKVTMPMYCRYGRCRGAVLSCKPRIGGGTSPACRVDPPRSFCEHFNFC